MSHTNQIKRVLVTTFGCQMNEEDSTRIIRLLAGRGYVPTEEAEKADLIFINTCSIRAKAEQKVMSYLGRLKPLKEAKPELILGVGGCVAQQIGERFFDQAPYLDLVLGTHQINALPELVEEVTATRRPICRTDFNYDCSRPSEPAIDHAGQIKAFLTIMQGCDNYCAYCVVPYVRGREISRPLADILTEARASIAAGVKEITLLGQNVNAYGRGLGVSFPRLLDEVAGLPGLVRLRFTTSHPKDLSPELIGAFGKGGPLCEHLHLPVQSGSTKILSAMGRGYTREEYLAKIEALRSVVPEMALTTDVIVGFPGETEEDFQETMSLLEVVRFDGLYSFKYSNRPMTRAARMTDQVAEAVKSRRLVELQARQKEITLAGNRSLIGRRIEVLVEGQGGRYPGQLTGRTRTNKIVNFLGPLILIGRLVHPLIEEAWANSLRGDDQALNKGRVKG